MRLAQLRVVWTALAVMFPALPAQAISVGAMPAYLVTGGPPGVSTEHEITLMNGTGTPVTFEPRVRDFGVDAQGKDVQSGPGTLPVSAAAWLSFHPKRVPVPAGGQGKIKVIVSVPANATGGHYALIMLDGVVDMPLAGGPTIRVGAGVGVKLYYAVSGKTREQVEAKVAKIQPPTPSERMEVVLSLHNSGDVHLRPTAEMVLVDANRRVVGRADAVGGGILLPRQTGILRLDWGGELKPETYTAVMTVMYGSADPLVLEQSFVVSGTALESRLGRPTRK